MEEMTRRELAFCYIYSQEIQKENSKAQVKLFLDSTEVEDGRTREYVKNVASGIKEHGEEITEKIERLHAKCVDTVCCPAEKLKNWLDYRENI